MAAATGMGERLASHIAPALGNSQLLQRLRQLALAAATIGVGVCVTDPEGRIEFVNRALEGMLGYDPNELPGRPMSDLYPGGSGDPMLQEIRAGLLTGGWSGEAELLAKSGDVIPTQETATPMRDEAGRLVGYVCVNADITERKRAEAEIRRLKKFNDRILASTTNGMLVLSSDLKIVFANLPFYKLLALKRSAVKGKRLAEIPYLEGLEELAAGALRNRNFPVAHEIIYLNPGGGRQWFIVRVSPLRENEEAILLTFADVTEQRQTEEKMCEVSRLISLGELVAGVAHELNNPLTAVLGFAQLLEAQDLDAPVKEDVRHILTAAQRAIKVVQNLLSFSRKNEPEEIRFDVSITVDRVLAIKEHDLRVSHIEVETIFDSRPLYVIADQHRLAEVFLNIVTNAAQAMASGHEPRKLLIHVGEYARTGAEGSGDFIRISFSDSGPGIATEDQERIFDPFFTTKEPGIGTGLGLSICRTLVQQQRGRIWIDSEAGEGATFHIELPVGEPT